MKTKTQENIGTCFALAVLAVLAACGNPQKAGADVQAMAEPMNAYLAAHGDLCLAKPHWPIDVPADEAGTRSRNGVQMPVLEQVGLVTAAPVSIEAREERPASEGIRYTLTDEGRKYLHARQALADAAPRAGAGQQDFCAAHLSLARIVSVTPHTDDKGGLHTLVTYTYKIDAAPWTQDPRVQHVFPMLDRVVRGAGVMELQQNFRHTQAGWVPESA